MLHQISIVLVCLGALFFIACVNHKETENVQIANTQKPIVYDPEIGDSSAFRMAIAKSIHIPFRQTFDTLIVGSQWRICGEIPDDFLINYPEPHLDKHPFIDTLSKLLRLKIISNDTFDKYMEVVLKNRFKGEYPESLYDTCLADNLHLNVVAKRLKDNSFLVITSYRANDTSTRIDNIFVRQNNNWTFKRVEIGPINR